MDVLEAKTQLSRYLEALAEGGSGDAAPVTGEAQAALRIHMENSFEFRDFRVRRLRP